MVLPGSTFRHVLDLPKVDWERIDDDRKAQVAERCQSLYSELPQIKAIEGVNNTDGAKYLYERALIDTLDLLGVTVDEQTREDLLLQSFLN